VNRVGFYRQQLEESEEPTDYLLRNVATEYPVTFQIALFRIADGH
jgi:hypothetical protein